MNNNDNGNSLQVANYGDDQLIKQFEFEVFL